MDSLQPSANVVPAPDYSVAVTSPLLRFLIYCRFILSQCLVNLFKSFLEEVERMENSKGERADHEEQLLLN